MLEFYHLPCLHTKKFTGVYPNEEAQSHDLDSRFTTLRYDLEASRHRGWLCTREERVYVFQQSVTERTGSKG